MTVKTTKTYLVCTGPIIVPSGEEYHIVEESKVHRVRGREVKGYMMADTGYFHIYDLLGQVVFSAPTSTVLWCKVEDTPMTYTMVPADPVRMEDENDHIDEE